MSDLARVPYDGNSTQLARWREQDSAPPSHAVWEITLRCDLGCRHCGSRAGKARTHELSTDAALNIVAELAELGLREITLIGGEFYLRDDWDLIAAEITRRGMMCSIVTGARQMNPDRIARAVAAGIGKISLSIDGLERTHDAIRGSKGSWAAAVDAGLRIAASGIDLSVNTQINRLTMPELAGLADRLAGIGVRSWMVILTAAMGRAADRRALMLQPYHLLQLFPMLAAIKTERLDPAGIAFFPANNLGYSSALAESLRYGADQGHAWGGCAAGTACLGIEADGTVKGCPSLPSADYTMGSLTERSFSQVWAERSRAPIASAEDLWGHCRTCPHAQRCRGGCTWTSHVLFGRRGNNPFCHFRTVTLAERGIAEIVEPVSAAPGRPFDFGLHCIREVPLDSVLPGDPVIERGLAAQIFGIRPGAPSLWSSGELADAVR